MDMSLQDLDRLYSNAVASDRECSSSHRGGAGGPPGGVRNHQAPAAGRAARRIPEFVGNGELGADGDAGGGDDPPKTWGRAPGDAEPFDKCEPEGQCFACRFSGTAQMGDDGGGGVQLGASELKSAYATMMGLIDTHYNNDTSVVELVNMVKEFYDEEIRSVYNEYGEWTKKSIYSHIFPSSEHAEDRQCNESIKALYHQIEFLRANTCIVNDITGQTMPDKGNIKMLMDLTKAHSTLVNERRRRAGGIR